MDYKIKYPANKDIEKMNRIALELFGPGGDSMVEPNLENAEKLISLEKNNLICFKENNQPISWALVLPTSREKAERFLKKEITELELFNRSVEKPLFESLYLFSVVTLPDYRKRGLSSRLVKYQIEYFRNKYKIKDFYAWALNPEGKSLIESLKKNVEPRIRIISEV